MARFLHEQGRSKTNGRIHILARLVYHGNFNRLWVSARRRGAETRGAGNCHSPRRLKVVESRAAISRPHPHLDARCHKPDLPSKQLPPSAMWTFSSITPAM